VCKCGDKCVQEKRHPGVRSAAEPAGIQTNLNVKAHAALADVVNSDARFPSLPVDWVPAFAGMTFEKGERGGRPIRVIVAPAR
jgi:hypothetical protein